MWKVVLQEKEKEDSGTNFKIFQLHIEDYS
jgi:hypothetical protein